MKKWLALLLVSLIIISLGVTNALATNSPIITSSGVIQSHFTSVERIDADNILVTENNGIEVKANLKIIDDVLSGLITTNDASYKLSGKTSSNEEFNTPYFEGSVTNANNLYFEAFLIGKDDAIVNIFGLSDEGERVEPFTVRLDGSKPEKKQYLEKSLVANNSLLEEQGDLNMSEYSIMSLDYDYFGGVSTKGIKMEAQGWKGRTSTPYVVRIWTVPSSPRNDSSQGSTIQSIRILRSQTHISGNAGSGFTPVSPNSNNHTSFNVKFKVNGIMITIPVRLNSVTVSSTVTSNPHTVNFYWNLKDAYTYQDGNDSEGILTEHTYWVGGTPNPWGYYESNVFGRLWYEVFGNYREYFDYSASMSIWYD